MRRSLLACLLAVSAAPAAPLVGLAPAATPPVAPDRAQGMAASAPIEHRYRIVGKIRLALFWVGRDDVGRARLTWRSQPGRTELTLLAGSDPDRAPRRLNQWVYLREELRPETGRAFVLRSVSSDDAASATALPADSGSFFGASCSATGDDRVTTAGTTVTAPDATYRMVDRVLDQIASARQWTHRDAAIPAGVDAGFLTALKHALDADADGTPSPTATPYVYNGALFDLRIRRRQQLGPTEIGARRFPQLVRMDLSVQKRETGDVTKFSVTYAPSARALPVQIFYQPSFWLRIELHLDEAVDVPGDPAADEHLLARIDAICGRSLRRSDAH